MDCSNCKEKNPPVPYIAHEADLARQERNNKRLWIALLLALFFLVITNGAWIWHESQFIDEEVVQEIDTGDGDAIVAGIGDVNYGEGSTDGEAEDSPDGR